MKSKVSPNYYDDLLRRLEDPSISGAQAKVECCFAADAIRILLEEKRRFEDYRRYVQSGLEGKISG